jgi:hypothetical protein
MDKKTMDAKMYETFHSEFGLKAEWLGKTFKDEKGVAYTITGLNPRSKKFPVLTNTGTSFSAPYLIALLTNSVDQYQKKLRDAYQKKVEKELKNARANFATQSKLIGVPKAWLDKTFRYGRKVYTIVGITSERRYPIVAQSNDGKVRFFAADYAKELLGEKVA